MYDMVSTCENILFGHGAGQMGGTHARLDLLEVARHNLDSGARW